MAKTIKRIQFDPPGRIEIFFAEDGHTEWQRFVSDGDYTDFLAARQVEINDGVQPALIPDWSAFVVAMFGDLNYQFIRQATTNQIQAQQLEISVAMVASGGIPLIPEVFFALWNAVIDGLESVPSTEAIQGWIAIAQSSNMPFTFSESGLLIGV